MSDEPMTDKPDWKPGFKALWISVALLVLYVASIGPAYRIFSRTESHDPHLQAMGKAIRFGYWPLNTLARSRAAGTVLSSYINLWSPAAPVEQDDESGFAFRVYPF
jgi:hypothetical protein